MSLRLKNFKEILIGIGLLFFIGISCVFPCMAQESPHQTEKAADYSTSDVISEIPEKITEDSLDVYVKETPLIDTGISGVSAILSFIAIIVSIYSVSMTRKMTKDTISLQKRHNRDEVRPLLSIRYDAHDMSIFVKNHGLGPAIMTSLTWCDGNNSAPTIYKLNENKWRKLGVRLDNGYTKRFLDDENDMDVLAPQESLCLIRGSIKNKGPENVENNRRIAESFADVKLVLKYTDIYRTKKWTVKKDCSWFYYQYHKE